MQVFEADPKVYILNENAILLLKAHLSQCLQGIYTLFYNYCYTDVCNANSTETVESLPVW